MHSTRSRRAESTRASSSTRRSIRSSSICAIARSKGAQSKLKRISDSEREANCRGLVSTSSAPPGPLCWPHLDRNGSASYLPYRIFGCPRLIAGGAASLIAVIVRRLFGPQPGGEAPAGAGTSSSGTSERRRLRRHGPPFCRRKFPAARAARCAFPSGAALSMTAGRQPRPRRSANGRTPVNDTSERMTAIESVHPCEVG